MRKNVFLFMAATLFYDDCIPTKEQAADNSTTTETSAATQSAGQSDCAR